MIRDRASLRQPPWRVALFVAGGLHAVAIGMLFVRFTPAFDPTAAQPAIAVEMAPPMAPPTPVHDAPTPRQIEAPTPTLPNPTPPRPRAPLFDPPPPLQVADVKAEVVVPLREQERPPVEKSNPLPPAPTTTELAAPDLKLDTKVAALQTGGASAGEASAADRWDARVLSRIEMTKRYPYLALQSGQQDEVEVVLAIDRSGQLREAQLGASRGFELLNDAALEAVRRAAPFPAPPKELDGDPIRISVIVRFVKARKN